ncbi:MAG: phosphoribosylanthranilate isomerase [Amaricoccus sp.]|uniref:phosphoribosylanthranilate isomerase n=1 Tax=Amaricoccus sp. TaxID=1872485 RepID=UPI0039E25BDB
MRVKICGLRSRAEVRAAAEAGASYVGVVFFPPSPRHMTLADARWTLENVPEGIARVALTVDADDATLADIVGLGRIDLLQLHGHETPERVAEVRSRFGLPVMKALGIAAREHLAAIDAYAAVADQLLIDARPPHDGALPGGNGLAFDWRLLAGRAWQVPWMLAGGLTPDNVSEAIRLTGANQVDVSSGVEARPGEKDPARVAAFIRAARADPLPA